ncbi:MAG TPA: tetratricopeptide repeat protein, partial [Candidatus Saccharimonadales bacterium]|nr:tetratricopeptide repeat protein [Candidatus Saccharimonadales bacterium]
LEQQLDLLAHHFWLSDDEDRKRRYLAAAADAARASYANAAAIEYLERLIPLLEGVSRIERSIALAQVLHVIGEIPRAEAIVTEARALAEAAGDVGLVARCDHSLAESARRVGRFDEAAELLERAGQGFAAVGDAAGEADVLQVTGTVAAQRGDTSLARERYLESLEVRERFGDEAGVAALTSNLGIVAQQQGDSTAAREYANRALQLYTKLGDRRRIGTCQVNLAWMDGLGGDHESARRRCEEAIRLAAEVGDRLNVGIAQNNLGDALRDLDRLDDAGRAYAAAVETYRELNDLGPLMAMLEDVAILAVRRGDHREAFALVGASDALRAAIGAPRSAGAEAALLGDLAPSRSALGDQAADSARSEGARLEVQPAIELAIEAARGGSAS